MPVVVNVPGSPFSAGSTPIYQALLVDTSGVPIPGTSLDTLTLTILDTMTSAVINGVSNVNILNTGRGTIDSLGNLTISLLSSDTSMTETTATSVQRSLIIAWTYSSGAFVGSHKANFTLLNLAAA